MTLKTSNIVNPQPSVIYTEYTVNVTSSIDCQGNVLYTLKY